MQAFSGAPKEKQIQTDKIVMVDEGSGLLQIHQ